MANKLKIFEKLGLIEKKDSDEGILSNASDLDDINHDHTEDSNNILLSNQEKSEIAVTEIQTPILDSNPIIQAVLNDNTSRNKEFLDNTESSVNLLNTNNSLSAQPLVTNKDLGIIEDVEKKLDAMIESYERNKLLSIEDIYRKASLIMDVKSTVFMVDVYSKALPENLPIDVKRDSVLNIMKASEIRIDDLLSDAYKRIDALNNVLESVVQSTDDLKTKNTTTIRDLEKRIEELKRNIIEREKFQETQNTMIEYEIQRIINIVDFVKPK